MNKFEKQLEKWNNGILRGGQAKLAKTLGVSTAIVALWATGKRYPSKGYVAKMAELFGVDAYYVARLFDKPSTTYPEPKASVRQLALRDKAKNSGYKIPNDAADCTQSNNVSLPFLASVPNGAEIQENEIVEWWTLPRRYARGAKYLLRNVTPSSTGNTLNEDLFFIQPADTPQEGKLMLAKANEQYLIGRVRKAADGKLSLCSEDKKDCALPVGEIQPVGVIVRKIVNID